MKNIEFKKDFKLKSVPELIEICMHQEEEIRFRLGRAKSPKSKRGHQGGIDFFASIAYHLQKNQPKT